jgi:uncharacterized protein (TIGR03435 family)
MSNPLLARLTAVFVALSSAIGVVAQAPAARPRFDAFEVATIKPAETDLKRGHFIKMESDNRFIEQDYTLKQLVAAAYDLNQKTISGGPPWLDSDHFDIEALTPGNVRPTHDEQMAMMRSLLAERFKLAFHRERKEFPCYQLVVAKGGPALKPTTAAADAPVVVGPGVVYPQKVVLPARNAAMSDFVSLLQRALMDRPVVDKTGLSGRYDFDLEWAPDETQFGGAIPVAGDDAPSPPLFTALQQQLGLRLLATRGPVDAMVIERAELPAAN